MKVVVSSHVLLSIFFAIGILQNILAAQSYNLNSDENPGKGFPQFLGFTNNQVYQTALSSDEKPTYEKKGADFSYDDVGPGEQEAGVKVNSIPLSSDQKPTYEKKGADYEYDDIEPNPSRTNSPKKIDDELKKMKQEFIEPPGKSSSKSEEKQEQDYPAFPGLTGNDKPVRRPPRPTRAPKPKTKGNQDQEFPPFDKIGMTQKSKEMSTNQPEVPIEEKENEENIDAAGSKGQIKLPTKTKEEMGHKRGNPYEFEYEVKDDRGNDYSEKSKSDGETITGEYRVLLPDGRTQVVSYIADWKRGFRVRIKYIH